MLDYDKNPVILPPLQREFHLLQLEYWFPNPYHKIYIPAYESDFCGN